MPDAGITGFATGFANSLDNGISLGMRAKENRERREERQKAEGRSEQQRIQQERADEALNAFDSGDAAPVVEAWNKSASSKGLPPEKAATAAEIDPSTGEVVIQHNDGTSTRKKSDQARAMLRAAYGVPARSAIPTEERAEAEDADYRRAITGLSVGEFDPLFNKVNTRLASDGQPPIKSWKRGDKGAIVTLSDGSEQEFTTQELQDLADDTYGQRRRRISDGDGENPAKPDALQKDIATQDASEFFSDWVDSTNLDPKDQEKMLSRFLEVMRDPNSKKGAIESMIEMGIPIKKYATIEPEMKDRLMKRMDEMRQQARSPTSPGGAEITSGEAARIAAIPKEDAKRRARPTNVRFGIDPNAAPGQAPAQQPQQTTQQAPTMSEQEFRDYAAEQGYPEDQIEESVAEYKRQGRIR